MTVCNCGHPASNHADNGCRAWVVRRYKNLPQGIGICPCRELIDNDGGVGE